MTELSINKLPTPSVSNVNSGAASTSARNVAQSSLNTQNNIVSEAGQTASAKIDAFSAVSETASRSAVVGNSSNIMTYRDSDSGRLVVRVVDKNNNAVISEFPSKTMLGNYPKLTSPDLSSSIDTKA